MEHKKTGWLSMRLDNMNDYLEYALKIQRQINETTYKPGTSEKEKVALLVAEINEKVEELKRIGFVKVKIEED